MPECFQGLFEVCRCLVECRTAIGPDASLPTVGHSLVPHRTPEGVQGQGLDLVRGLPSGRKALRPRSHLGQAVSVTLFERFDNTGVEQTAALLEEAAVGYLVRQGVLEG